MNLRRIVLSLTVCCAAACVAENANAQCGGAWGFNYGSYAGVGDLYRVLSHNVPHFAAFPPVYYSVPVPRTYGYSPFAYLPHVQTPEAPAPMPEVIDNPYFEPSSDSTQLDAGTLDQTTAAALKSDPSWNFAARRWKVYSFPSGLISHDVASSGST